MRPVSAERQAEPGYYLISRGRPAFERELGFHVSWKRWLLRLYVRAAVPGLSGHHCRCHRYDPGAAAAVCPRGGMTATRPFAPRFARRCACLGPGDRTDQPRGDGFAWAAKAAANGAAPRHPRRLANDRRHAHAADHPGGNCRACRAAGSALSGESRWRPALRAALGLGGCALRNPAG